MPSTRFRGEDLVQLIPEPERSLLRRRVQEPIQDPVEEMGDAPRPLKYYAIPSQDKPHNSIATPAIEANNFELKRSLLSAV